jgi:hypothetical protein
LSYSPCKAAHRSQTRVLHPRLCASQAPHSNQLQGPWEKDVVLYLLSHVWFVCVCLCVRLVCRLLDTDNVWAFVTPCACCLTQPTCPRVCVHASVDRGLCCKVSLALQDSSGREVGTSRHAPKTCHVLRVLVCLTRRKTRMGVRVSCAVVTIINPLELVCAVVCVAKERCAVLCRVHVFTLLRALRCLGSVQYLCCLLLTHPCTRPRQQRPGVSVLVGVRHPQPQSYCQSRDGTAELLTRGCCCCVFVCVLWCLVCGVVCGCSNAAIVVLAEKAAWVNGRLSS